MTEIIDDLRRQIETLQKNASAEKSQILSENENLKAQLAQCMASNEKFVKQERWFQEERNVLINKNQEMNQKIIRLESALGTRALQFKESEKANAALKQQLENLQTGSAINKQNDNSNKQNSRREQDGGSDDSGSPCSDEESYLIQPHIMPPVAYYWQIPTTTTKNQENRVKISL